MSEVHVRREAGVGSRRSQISCAMRNAQGVYEGDWEPRRIAWLEFPTFAAWEQFYYGPTYQRLKTIRDASSSARLVGVEDF